MVRLGIDLGGTNIVAGVLDEQYHIIARSHIPVQKARGFSGIAADMAAAAKIAIREAGLSTDDFLSVGIGAPSVIDPVTSRLLDANNLGWRDAPLAEEFRKHIDKPVYIANDADAAALGEFLEGAAKGRETALMLTLGTGIGGGLISKGKIFTGFTGGGFEPGHIVVVPDGANCTCGGRGCLEASASAMALIRDAKEALEKGAPSLIRLIAGGDLRAITAKMVFDAASQGDETAKELVSRFIRYLGIGAANLICVFRPHIVVFGGGIAEQGETLLAPLRKEILKNLYGTAFIKPPEIVNAALGNDAGVLGAAFLGANSAVSQGDFEI